MDRGTGNDNGRAAAAPFVVFRHGEVGAAHVRAHEAADAGRHDEGGRELADFLSNTTGSGSAFVHLHFHMATFELAQGQWQEALERYDDHIGPAVRTDDALTDAPALLWRLQLQGRHLVDDRWGPVRGRALRRRGWEPDPYVELHHLLALAGAGDLEGLEAWLADLTESSEIEAHVLRRFGRALVALVLGDYRATAAMLRAASRHVHRLGGSEVQNSLFEEMASMCDERASEDEAPPSRAA